MAPNTDVYTRACVITLKSPSVGKSTSQISELTGINPRTVDRIYSRAIAAGFEPNVLPLKILPHHVQDSSRSGRPLKQTEEVKEEVIHHPQRSGYLSIHGLESVERGRIPQDKANEEAWSDTEDERGEIQVGS
ncbi:hypothetical protein AA0116_g13419 [Alternaria tenuissima]|nr:hypothetical protein AA0116_g13419 [Alternaria tenuissima]